MRRRKATVISLLATAAVTLLWLYIIDWVLGFILLYILRLPLFLRITCEILFFALTMSILVGTVWVTRNYYRFIKEMLLEGSTPN